MLTLLEIAKTNIPEIQDSNLICDLLSLCYWFCLRSNKRGQVTTEHLIYNMDGDVHDEMNLPLAKRPPVIWTYSFRTVCLMAMVKYIYHKMKPLLPHQMSTTMSQIIDCLTFCSTAYSGLQEGKHKGSIYWSFAKGINGDYGIPITKGQWCVKCFHVMISSCDGLCLYADLWQHTTTLLWPAVHPNNHTHFCQVLLWLGIRQL